MAEKQANLKVWPETANKLRMLHAYTGKPIVQIIDDWASEELERFKRVEAMVFTAKDKRQLDRIRRRSKGQPAEGGDEPKDDSES